VPRRNSAEARVPGAPALSAAVGYAYHDARFVHFAFRNEAGELVVVDGKRTELVPRSLGNARVAFAPAKGPGGFLAIRHSGPRFLDRRNLYETDPAIEVDLGATYDFRWGRLSLIGRNVGDSRHPVTDSEIGDGQVYVSPPRRFTAEIAMRF
jgi:outer membrane receptor protein involved in Fe transport